MSDFTIIRPITVTDAMLTGSNIAEPDPAGADADPAAWAAGAYAVGARVSRPTVHKVYQCTSAVAAPGTTAPENDSGHWVAEGPTNRWRAFDQSNTTQATNAEGTTVTYQITPSQIADALMFDNVDADSIRVQVAATSYDKTIDLKYRDATDWWKYFFEPFSYKDAVVFTGLPLLITNVINITITKGGGNPKVGNIVLGLSKVIGTTQTDAQPGIIDYSVKETDSFGNVFVAQRDYSKRMNVTLTIPSANVDGVHQLLRQYRAKPIVWIGGGNSYSCLIMYRYYRDFGVVIANHPLSRCALTIEGLT